MEATTHKEKYKALNAGSVAVNDFSQLGQHAQYLGQLVVDGTLFIFRDGDGIFVQLSFKNWQKFTLIYLICCNVSYAQLKIKLNNLKH